MKKHYRIGLRNGRDFRFFGFLEDVEELCNLPEVIYFHEIGAC